MSGWQNDVLAGDDVLNVFLSFHRLTVATEGVFLKLILL